MIPIEINRLIGNAAERRVQIQTGSPPYLVGVQEVWSRDFTIGTRKFVLSAVIADLRCPPLPDPQFVAMTVAWTDKLNCDSFISRADLELNAWPQIYVIESDMAAQRQIMLDWCEFKRQCGATAR